MIKHRRSVLGHNGTIVNHTHTHTNDSGGASDGTNTSHRYNTDVYCSHSFFLESVSLYIVNHQTEQANKNKKPTCETCLVSR